MAPGFTFHFTPDGSSWLNLAERWLAELITRNDGLGREHPAGGVGERLIELRYERRGTVVRRRVDPLCLVLKGAAWYIVAAAHRPTGLRSFRIDRIRSVTPLGRAIERPEGFDLATAWAELQAGFEDHLRTYRVTARMDRERIGRLQHALPEPSASRAFAAAEVAAGDPVTVTIESESLPVAHGELLRLGAWIEVLDPPELRSALRETGEAMAAHHR